MTGRKDPTMSILLSDIADSFNLSADFFDAVIGPFLSFDIFMFCGYFGFGTANYGSVGILISGGE